MKLFKNLMQSIQHLSDNPKQFKSALNKFLYADCFYSIEENFNVNRE
jgi:hypothetical protein